MSQETAKLENTGVPESEPQEIVTDAEGVTDANEESAQPEEEPAEIPQPEEVLEPAEDETTPLEPPPEAEVVDDDEATEFQGEATEGEDQMEMEEEPPSAPYFYPEEEGEGAEEEEAEPERKLSGLETSEEEVYDFKLPPNFGEGDTSYDMMEDEGEGYEYIPMEMPQRASEEMLEEKPLSVEEPPPDLDLKDEDQPKNFICTEEEQNRTLQMESYCCQQIKIPPMLPHILKSYTKAAIRTQPRDLLRWSVAYFKAMAADEPPPAKDRLEYPTIESPCGLTKGLLRVLHKQLGKNEQVLETNLRDKWMGLCLDGAELTKLLHLNSLDDVFDWTKFVVVASASIVNEHIVEAMSVFCDTMTQQPDGVDPYISYELFADAYTFLADKMGVDMRQAENVCSFLRDLSKANFDLVGPKDFMAPECPPLF